MRMGSSMSICCCATPMPHSGSREDEAQRPGAEWLVYIIQAADDTLYTGVTTDLERRLEQHCAGKGGAKYLRGRGPLRVVFAEGNHDRSSALRRELAIKRFSRQQKLQLIRDSA